MANDVNANIRINLDTSDALADLKSLQSRISAFNQSVIQSNAQAVAAQKGLLGNFQAQIGASRQFSTAITNVETSTSKLQTAIDKNKLSMGQYFKYGVASSRNFGKVFRQENEAITRLATERVRKLQTQYVALGESQRGMTRALQVRPLQMFNADSAIAIQRSQIFNKLLQDGSTSLVNWGKNTQWAGRQLMVGFSIPLSIFGGMASKIFMELEEQAISFRKVYGDIFTSEAEVEQNLAAVRELTQEMTKYGIAAKETFELANIAAQSGARGADLLAQTTQATRLAVLGQMEQQEAVRTTITLQNAFRLSNEDLADSINFLNIVENQSVLSLQDVAGAIPRVAPVVKSLGGDVRDLSVMLVAMREGGVSAAEGANALKTSLARLISPTAGASKMAKELGINLSGIIEANQGDILGAVLQLAGAMEELDELSQQRLLSEIFGKRQYARVGALFNNITDNASQAQRVLDLTTMSTEELAQTAEKELGAVEESISTKFTAAVELLKTEIAPIGEQFLKIATPIIESVSKIFAKFNELSPTVKNFIAILATGIGVVVPIGLMLVGLFGNLIGNLAKGIATLTGFFTRIRSGGDAVDYLSGSQLEAVAAAASLEGQTSTLTSSLNIQREAVDALARSYRQYVAGANAAAANLPQGFRGPTASPQGFANGGMVGGRGNSDNQPALLMPGEFVMNKEATEQFLPILDSMNRGSIEGFAEGSRASRQSGAASRKFKSGAFVLRGLGSNIGAGGSGTGILTSILTVSANDIADVTSLYVSEIAKAAKVSVTAINSEIKNWQKQNMAYLEQFNRELATAIESGDFAEQQRLLDQVSQKFVADMERAGGPVSQFAAQAERQFPELSADLERTQSIIRNTNLNLQDANQASQFFEDNMQETALMSKLSKPGSFQTQARVASGVLPFFGPDISRTGVPGQFIDPKARSTAGNVSSFGLARSQSKLLYGAGTSAEHVMKTPQQLAKEAKKIATVASQAAGEAVVQEMKEASVRAGKAVGPAVMKGANAASPPPWSTQLGIWIGEGIERGAVTALEDVNAQIRSQFGGQPFGGMVSGPVSPFSVNPFAGAPKGQTSSLVGGMRMAPQSVQDDLIRATKNASGGLNNAGKQASKTANRFAGLRGGITKFGGALKNGSMKMQGAFFALDGLVFAASMADNSLGQIAQKALPLVFGIQGLTMVLPLLANPIVLAGAALAAVAGGMWMLESKRKEAQQNLVDMSVATDGSAKAFRELAEEIGQMRPTERFAAILSGVKTEEEEQGLTEGQQFLESEAGQGMVERASSLAGKQRMTALQRELTSAISLQIITPDQAKSIARALSLSFNDPVLGQTLVSNISQYVRRSSKDVAAAVNEMLKGVETDVEEISIETGLTDQLTQEMELLLARDALTEGGALPAVEKYDYDEEGNIIAIETVERLTKAERERLNQLLEMEKTDPFANIKNNIGPAINAATKLAEAQALISTEYRRGNISSEQFADATDRITEKQSELKNIMTGLSEDTFGPTFGKYFDMAAKSIGLTQEELDAINTQADALQGVLENLGVTAAEEAGNLLRFAMASGQIDAATAGMLPELMQDKRYKVVIDQVIEEGDPGALAELVKGLTQIDMFPDPIQARIMATFDGDWDDPAAVNRWLQEALVNSSFFVDNPNIQMQVMARLNEDPANFTTEYANQLEDFYKKAEQEVGVNLRVRSLEDVENAYKWLKKIEETKNLKKELNVLGNWQSVFKAFGITYKEFEKLPDISKAIIIDYVTRYTTIQQSINLAEQTAAGSGDSSAKQLANQFLLGARGTQQDLGEAARGIFDPEIPGIEDEDDDTDGTGGSEREKSFLEKLRSDLEVNAQLYLNAKNGLKGYAKNRGNFFGAFQKLRREGVPEALISALGTGPEAIKRARELLALGKEELDELIKDFERVSVGEVVENARRKAIENEQRARAARKTKDLDPDLQQIVLADKELTRAFATTKKGTPEYERLLKVVRRLANAKKDLADATATEADKQKEAIDAIDEARQPILDDFERREALFRQAFGQLEREWQPILDANQKQIDLLQGQVDAVQDEIDAIERLNDADERRIRNLERQKEMLNRQIETLSRQNEMDQRRIETLNRQDELRNRVADALSKELENMDRQETKIRDMYEKRFEALDKIAKVNDYIVSQQKQQISLSRALSEGDIFAAVEAAQQMRADAAQRAREQTRAGLEEGMEQQVAGLRTEGGLTREEAEEKIRQIQEQSYQTSLKIREIEDLIYQRNLEMIPLKDQQYTLDQQIQGIQDIIYGRESQILDIQVKRLQPLQDQLDAQQQSLSNNQKALADAKAAVRIEGQTYDELQNQISAEKEAYDVTVASIKAGGDVRNSVENIRKKWVDVTKQIAAAVRTAKSLSEQAEIVASGTYADINMDLIEGRITPDTAEQRIAAARAARESSLAAISETRDAEIAAALASGTQALRFAAGGMVKPKGYRGGGIVSGMQSLYAGGVVGDGARDSVPAMLTPGEFVIRRSMVKKYGKGMMADLNMGSFSMPSYGTGGPQASAPIVSTSSSSVNMPVYNSYDMSFTINGTDADANDIAREVMNRMQRIQDASLRGNRV